MNLLEARGLGKAFGGVTVLQGIDFDLQAGEVHALMGENGAGKSTLMKILAGVHAADTGEVLLDGKPVRPSSPREAQDLGIALIHQELQLMPDLSAAANVFIGRERRRTGWRLDHTRQLADTQVIFERLGLSLDPRRAVGTLSVAQQQMVEIAKALSLKARVLIMDEPTAALNPEEVEELFRVVRQLRAEGVGIIYISHKMDELRRIADRVTVLRDGRLIATQDMAGAEMDELIRLMVGRELQQTAHAAPDLSAAPVLLEARRLSRGRAVREASFTLRRGEILGLAGLMGAGRTELARLVFGADRRDGGDVLVNGKPADIRSPADAVRHGIAYLSEDRKGLGLATGLDVEANLLMPSLARFTGALGHIDRRAGQSAAQAFVQRLGIKTPSLGQTVARLSGGNQQKIALAKWLLRDCDILIVDEPTRGIDVGAKAEIHRLLRELAAAGKALIVISSELPELLGLAHRILVMCEGRISGELPAADATQEALMALATRRETEPA
ncbi:ribose transport system ATP-binding protein [Pelomonas aquatica]|uniref:Ribose transport system ATP-binding protein n=1 Tax=Pelomonas aquatica TaxID=431058 RepID=A0ABU1Z3S1_9BURK|nr:sugar ABC transporter ATP-binding protein [Pelomonas aquatica]MDR7295255.1 ribose transport system ATP-binding protein [Pelomonas aquatica]